MSVGHDQAHDEGERSSRGGKDDGAAWRYGEGPPEISAEAWLACDDISFAYSILSFNLMWSDLAVCPTVWFRIWWLRFGGIPGPKIGAWDSTLAVTGCGAGQRSRA